MDKIRRKWWKWEENFNEMFVSVKSLKLEFDIEKHDCDPISIIDYLI